MSRHSQFNSSNGIHTNVAFTYTSALLRVTASTLSSVDIGKIAFQSDNNSYWMLMGFTADATPTPIWINVSSTFYSYIYGDGYDGNLTLSGSTTVTFTRDMYYDIVTIPSGITGAIYTNGYQLFCKTLNLSGAPANSIKIQATYNSSTVSLPTININGILCGGRLGLSGELSGNAGNSPALTNYVVNGGNGGNGGTGQTGGQYGTVYTGGTGNSAKKGLFLPKYPLKYLLVLDGYINGGQSGGGGGFGGMGGGASGTGAGVMRIFAQNIITDETTAAGVINVAGGTGGNGTDGGGIGYAGGGGGGGGGGYLEIWYETRTGTTVTNLINAAGGAGGNAGNTGTTTGGSNGGQGTVLIGCTSTGVVTPYIGNPASSSGPTTQTGAPVNTYNVSF